MEVGSTREELSDSAGSDDEMSLNLLNERLKQNPFSRFTKIFRREFECGPESCSAEADLIFPGLPIAGGLCPFQPKGQG
jgi:hypothetical protein